jgi:hypothetical protein
MPWAARSSAAAAPMPLTAVIGVGMGVSPGVGGLSQSCNLDHIEEIIQFPEVCGGFCRIDCRKCPFLQV